MQCDLKIKKLNEGLCFVDGNKLAWKN